MTTPQQPITLSPWHVLDTCTSDEHAAGAILHLVGKELPGKGVTSLDQWIVLTPQHKGACGTVELNRALQRHWQETHYGVTVPTDAKHTQYYRGDRIVWTKNDYDVDLMNGTLATVVDPDARIDGVPHMTVITTDGESRSIPRDAEHMQCVSLAYAMTAHKAQGSEFPVVIVVCVKAHSFTLSRAWLYTACTRAKTACVIVGERLAVTRALANAEGERRRTWLSVWGAQ